MMPLRKDGLGTIIDIIQENPSAKILVLGSFAKDDKVFPAIKAGALMYLLKNSSSQELLTAIQNIHQGANGLRCCLCGDCQAGQQLKSPHQKPFY
jgi:two-component system, NarL family, response regulator LiaR